MYTKVPSPEPGRWFSLINESVVSVWGNSKDLSNSADTIDLEDARTKIRLPVLSQTSCLASA